MYAHHVHYPLSLARDTNTTTTATTTYYLANVDTATYFWENHKLDKLVFQPHGIPLLVCGMLLNAVGEWQWVDTT